MTGVKTLKALSAGRAVPEAIFGLISLSAGRTLGTHNPLWVWKAFET